jgi:hypothetical protein
MPSPTLSDAIKEAYASASSAAPAIETISVYYNGLVDDDDNPTELYIFTGANATSYRDDGLPLLSGKIEATAARNAGDVVTFLGIPFAITLPNVTEDPEVTAQITVDNVGREMSDLLAAAATSGNAVYMTYRPYIAGSELEGPEADPPITFILKNVQAPGSTVTADLITQTIGNRRFPFETYTPERFPTLQYG